MKDKYLSVLISENRNLANLRVAEGFLMDKIGLGCKHSRCGSEKIYLENEQMYILVFGIALKFQTKPIFISSSFKFLQLMFIHELDEIKVLVGSLFLDSEGNIYTDTEGSLCYSDIGATELHDQLIEFAGYSFLNSPLSSEQKTF